MPSGISLLLTCIFPHLAAKRTTLSAFAAGLTIRTFSFTQGKTHALTATGKSATGAQPMLATVRKERLRRGER
jgi:hypothetical protein